MTTGQVGAFAVAALVLIVVPGPSVLFVVGRALAHGRRTALASVIGNEAGLLAAAVCVALGVGTVVARSTAVFTAVKLVGAAYLIWLGVQAIRHRGALGAPGTPAGRPVRGDWHAARQGFIVGATNPKTFVILASVLPQFVHRQAGNVPLQMLELGLVAVVIALVCDTCWSLAAARARTWFARSPARTRLVGSAGGASMIGLGVSLAVTGKPE